MMEPLTPQTVTYTATYKIDCPHGCYEGATVTVIQSEDRRLVDLRVKCNIGRRDYHLDPVQGAEASGNGEGE